ncbi:MAG: glyceraldehyde 3-phosphate dehydrogenase NAD-binding domain-containing protein, partial [bacterium]
ADKKTLAHLLKYDSIYGMCHKNIDSDEEFLIIDEHKVKCLSEKDPSNLPWKKLGIDIVLECTGRFTNFEKAKAHIQTGAKKVIISAPCKGSDVSHFVLGVNQDKYKNQKDDIVSMGSCTTNCLAVIAKVLHQNFEIETGLMTTIHSYTNDQSLLDSPHKDLRRARSAGLSIIPTTTGAAISVSKTIPELKGKINGLAVRVPTAIVSLVDFTVVVKEKVSVEKVNDVFKGACSHEKLKGILSVEDIPLVSIDYKGSSFSAIVDLRLTMVQEKNMIKVLAWYDNEWGYACRLAEFADFVGNKF